MKDLLYLDTEYGNSDGDDYDYGDGEDYGDGYGSGDGYGDGYGSGDGYGFGYGYGEGYGYGYGYGVGYGEVPLASLLISHTDCNATPELGRECGCMAVGLNNEV